MGESECDNSGVCVYVCVCVCVSVCVCVRMYGVQGLSEGSKWGIFEGGVGFFLYYLIRYVYPTI